MGLISNGTTIFDNGSMASGFGGDMVLVSSATASASASIEFSLGSYKEYKFFFVNIHPQTDVSQFLMNYSTDGTNFNVTQTSTFFASGHSEDDSVTTLEYRDASDVAQSINPRLADNLGNDNDQCFSGTMSLFNPSSTSFVKHWIGKAVTYNAFNYAFNQYSAGYANTTSALTNIKFQMSSGNIDDGKILMFGIN